MDILGPHNNVSSISEELYIVLCWYAFSVNAWDEYTQLVEPLIAYNIGMSYISTIFGVTLCVLLCAAKIHGMVS